jgi:hypothetical protein
MPGYKGTLFILIKNPQLEKNIYQLTPNNKGQI